MLAVLMDAAEKRLLVSDGQLLESVRSTSSSSDRVRINSIGVVTKDRPEAVRRCLRSFAEHLRSFNRRVRMVVVDSSPSAGAGRSRAASMQLARALDTTVSWIGVNEKVALADALAHEAGVDPALARFAVLGVEGQGNDVGANRNALLLALAGEPFLSTDDDMLCDLRVAAGASDRILLSSDELPAAVTLHRDFASARDSLVPSSVSVLERHEQLLGRRLGACLSEGGRDRISCRSIAPTFLTSLLSDQARIAATFGGYYGDAGARYPTFYLWSTPAMREQLLGGIEEYQTLIASRQMVRIAPIATVSSGRFSMCGNVALDARGMLPPFFPNLRGEDLSFGMLLRSCLDHSLFAYLPQALAHVPIELRRTSADRLWDPALSVPMLLIIAQVLDMAEASVGVAATGERRLRLTGRWIRELAMLPNAEFQGLLGERVTFAVGLQDPYNPLAPSPALGYQTQMDQCARCQGRKEDGPDDRCDASIYGGDYCAGTCDDLGLCTCREVGDCDGYGG